MSRATRRPSQLALRSAVSSTLAVVALAAQAQQASTPPSPPATSDLPATPRKPATEDKASNSTQLDSVVVTSQKRIEYNQDVPISINVIGARTLQNLGAQNFTDLISTVPSLSSFQTGPGRSQLIIRGITTGGITEDDPQTQETVGLYVDESPISVNGFNPEYGLFDLQRVEVLRGPQGTLYGAGAMSGALKLITRKPDLNTFGGSVEADVGRIKSGGTSNDERAVVNVPLVANVLGLRASLFHDRFGGYIDNSTTGEKDLNHSSTEGGRVAVRYQPTDRLTVDVSYFGQATRDGGRPIDEGNLKRAYISPEGSNSQYQLANATVDLDVGFADLVSSSSYLKFDITNRRELDKTLQLFTQDLHAPLADQTHLKDFTQELRLASKDNGAFRWLGGVYFNRRRRDYVNQFPVPGFDAELPAFASPQFGAPPDNPFYGFDNVDVTQSALFGEAAYTLGKFTVTGGLRGFHWVEDFFLFSSGFFNGGITTTGQRKTTTNGSTPKLNVTYRYDENELLYVQAAKGFRFGGINQIIPLNLCASELAANKLAVPSATYNPDSLWNYELGSKSTLLDGRMTVNASVFLIRWKNIQASRSLNCGFSYRENAAGLTSKGVELETSIRPMRGLTLTLGGSYVDATLSQDVPDLSASKGDHAPFVPKVSVSASGEYRFPVFPGWDGFVWAAYQHVGQRTTEFSPLLSRYRVMDSYNVVNSRIGAQQGPVEVALYVKNLANSGGVLRALASTPFDAEGAYRITPRTIGMTARYTF